MYLYTIYDNKKNPRMPQTAKVKVESKKKFLRIFIDFCLNLCKFVRRFYKVWTQRRMLSLEKDDLSVWDRRFISDLS